MSENQITINISCQDKNSFAYKKVCRDIMVLLRNQGIAVQYLEENELKINSDSVFSPDQVEELNKGGQAYRNAVMTKGFKGTQQEWFQSLRKSFNDIRAETDSHPAMQMPIPEENSAPQESLPIEK